MTDNDIKKALNGADGLEHISVYCADNNGEDVCSIKLVDIIDLINRQQVEIENLTVACTNYEKALKSLKRIEKKAIREIKTEAIKEFAELVKMEFYKEFDELIPSIMSDKIDNLVKEMTESVNYGSSKKGGEWMKAMLKLMGYKER